MGAHAGERLVDPFHPCYLNEDQLWRHPRQNERWEMLKIHGHAQSREPSVRRESPQRPAVTPAAVACRDISQTAVVLHRKIGRHSLPAWQARRGLAPPNLRPCAARKTSAKSAAGDMPTYLAMKKNGSDHRRNHDDLRRDGAGNKGLCDRRHRWRNRGGEVTMDISADLQELKQTSVALFARAQSRFRHGRRTLEYPRPWACP